MANLGLHASREKRLIAATIKRAVKNEVRRMMNRIVKDPVMLLEIVGRGQFEWRQAFLREFKSLGVDENIANALYFYLVERAKSTFPGLTPHQALDALHVESPVTDKEIDDAWVIESSSSEEGRRFFYGPDGHPEDLVRKMARFTPDEGRRGY